MQANQIACTLKSTYFNKYYIFSAVLRDVSQHSHEAQSTDIYIIRAIIMVRIANIYIYILAKSLPTFLAVAVTKEESLRYPFSYTLTFIYCLLFQRLSLYSFKESHLRVQPAKLLTLIFALPFPGWVPGDTRNRIVIILLPIREVIKSLFTFSLVTALYV